MDRLASWLLVGPALKSEHYTRLAHEGVTHVLDLREERTDDQSVLRELGIAYRRLPLVNEDAPTDEQISEAVDWLEREVISAGGAVYMHCQGGMGRAPTCSMALLMHRGYSLSDAHRLVLAARPETAPSDTQVAWLEALQARLRGDGPTMRQERASR